MFSLAISGRELPNHSWWACRSSKTLSYDCRGSNMVDSNGTGLCLTLGRDELSCLIGGLILPNPLFTALVIVVAGGLGGGSGRGRVVDCSGLLPVRVLGHDMGLFWLCEVCLERADNGWLGRLGYSENFVQRFQRFSDGFRFRQT